MPNPLSRIQLLWHRFCPPPDPAKAIAPKINAMLSPSGILPKLSMPTGNARHDSGSMAKIIPRIASISTAATLTKIRRSSAT